MIIIFFSCRLQMVALLARRENEGKLVKVRVAGELGTPICDVICSTGKWGGGGRGERGMYRKR